VQQLLDAYDEVLPLLSSAVRDGNVRDQLRCEPLKPLFRVR
jgi:glutamate-1-semialdehyde 2,1-aminomutase